jgi:phage shock protein PspC (stress-responsive transcriptional regulator)
VPTRRLTRSRTDVKVAGVCAGLADYLDVDVVLVRAAWLVFSIVPGAVIGGVIAYLVAWLLLPEASESAPSSQRRRLTLSATDAKLAGVCGGLAEYFEVDATAIRLVWVIASIFFGAIIGGFLAYVVAWLIIPKPAGVVLSTAAPPFTV